MVRSTLKRKVHEIADEETKYTVDDYGGEIKCMMNGVICYPGAKNILDAELRREMRTALGATKIVQVGGGSEGQPVEKIVYVDEGLCPSVAMHRKAKKHYNVITRAEKDKAKREGKPWPRLIFVMQDKDYWPGSENDPHVMERRVAKERAKPYGRRPDYMKIYVAPMSEEDEIVPPPYFANGDARKAYKDEVERRFFMRFYDPSMPGTKFILDNVEPSERCSVLEDYKKNPELWEAWMRLSSKHDQEAAALNSNAQDEVEDDVENTCFMRFYDPSKFILDNVEPNECHSVLQDYNKDPELWKGMSSKHNQDQNQEAALN